MRNSVLKVVLRRIRLSISNELVWTQSRGISKRLEKAMSTQNYIGSAGTSQRRYIRYILLRVITELCVHLHCS